MATSYKALAVAQQIFSTMSVRAAAASLACTQSLDTDGNPLIYLGAGSNGGQNALIKIQPASWPLATNSLGTAEAPFVPTIALLATETSGTALTSIDTVVTLSIALGELMSRSLRVEWYLSANGTAPSASTFATASNLKATFDPNLYGSITSAGQ